MINEYLIPPGFKDEVNFEAYIEHEFKNKIINYFRKNGFDLVKTPLVEFNNKINNNSFLIETKKKEDQLKIRNDITPQIIRLVSSRLSKRKRPLKLCYYGEVVRKKGSMLRPERQFLQVGAETIGEDKVYSDIEIIKIAYESLKILGIKKITIELSSRIFLDKLFSKIKNKKSKIILEKLIKKKDFDNCLSILDGKELKFLKNIILCIGEFQKVNSKLKLLCIDKETTNEIKRIKEIVKNLELKLNDDIYLDFSETDEKNYHNGIRFTFFAKNVRGEIASGGRYKINDKNLVETATGFTCFMDTIVRASSIKKTSKKILIFYNTEDNLKNNLIKKGYILYSIFKKTKNLKEIAKKYDCNYYLVNKKVKKI